MKDNITALIDELIKNSDPENISKLEVLKGYIAQIEQEKASAIAEIAELNAEANSYTDLMQQATEKIKELNTRLALETTAKGKSKPYMSEKKAKALEAKVAELESCLGLFSSSDLDSKSNELEDYLRRLLKLKKEVSELGHKKHKVKNALHIEEELTALQAEINSKYMKLQSSILNFKQLKNGEITIEDVEKANDNILEITSLIDDIVLFLISRLRDKDKEIKSLRYDIEINGDTSTKEELLETLKNKDKLIEAYKDKIAGLEHQLNAS